jgi:hypothetical protein
MSLSASFRRSARAEFIEAAARYESERQNLGVEFIAEIERCVGAAAERPMAYTAVYKDVRRVIAKRFPNFPRSDASSATTSAIPTTTLAPASRKRCAMAAPMPRDPPVTRCSGPITSLVSGPDQLRMSGALGPHYVKMGPH